MHTTAHILMVRPVSFTYNLQTAVNNAFQVAGNETNAQLNALREFDAFVDVLRSNDVDVMVIDDSPEPHTPDSIFPNNWISFHSDGKVVLYPMYAENRRQERKPAVLHQVNSRFRVREVMDLTSFEDQNRFLEGTGSLVLDREKNIAYACLSPRTDADLVQHFCDVMHYHPVLFHAFDAHGGAIYHTNVMMCVADRYVVICLESITDKTEQQQVIRTIINSGKELIEITTAQMNHFAGNMLQVNNVRGNKLLVMSSQAYDSLTPVQIARLESYNRIIHAPLYVIETNGGGSARCMMAEVHLQVVH